MKTTAHPRAVVRLLLTLGLLAALVGSGHSQQNKLPRETLDVDSSLVRSGTRSKLAWNIEYPMGITDIVEVGSTGTIRPKRTLKMRARVLGVAFQAGNALLPLDAYWALNGGPWENFFYGTSPTVSPSAVLIDTKVEKNDLINFGARGWGGSGWLSFNHTRSQTRYVTVLGNGSRAPSYAPAYERKSVTGFLRPYVDAAGRINIGERDLIVLWEASPANPSSASFDMQDLVVLLSFEQASPASSPDTRSPMNP